MQSATGKRGWTPPKGVRERGETDLGAAYRETKEETGLAAEQLRLLSEEPIHCGQYWDGKIKKDKVSVYFVAELIDANAVVTVGSDRRGNLEIADSRWLPLVAAKELTGYEEMRRLLDAAAVAIEEERSRSSVEVA